MAKEKDAKRFYYTPGNPPPKVRLECKDVSLARQSEAARCDINVIVKQFQRGEAVYLNSNPGLFLDISEMGDYREALEQVESANKFFMAIPADVRAKFKNDPAEFLDFVSNPGNRDALKELGLIAPDGASETPSKASSEASSGS